jgi:hypothetical protein
MSCAVMRTWLPALATLPSSTAPTCSCAPILSMSSFLPLKANDEERAATCRPDTLDRAVIRSSVMPSLKYSFSLSELMFTNGNTATDFFAADTEDCDAAVGLGSRSRDSIHQTRPVIRTPTAVATTPRRSFRFLAVAAGVAFSLALGTSKGAKPSSPASRISRSSSKPLSE